MRMVKYLLGIQLIPKHLSLFYSFLFLFKLSNLTFSVAYDDDDLFSFAKLDPTIPSYTHLTDALSIGLGNFNSNNSSSALTFDSNSLLNSSGGPTSISSNHSACAYSPYSNHPIPSPVMQIDYQHKKQINLHHFESLISF